MSVAGSTRATLIPDIEGSIIGTLDAVTGTLTNFGYLPYGESTSISGTFRYTGQRIDPETNGLYYYRARMYMPAWGRFMQHDPIGFQGGTNLYAYVSNNPLNLLDPFGFSQDSSRGAGGWLTAAQNWLGAIGQNLSYSMAQQAQAEIAQAQAQTQFAQQNPYLYAGLYAAPVIVGAVVLAPELLGGSAAAEGIEGGLTVFRVVASDSPAFQNALRGVANPIGGWATMLEHSLGNTASNFTSWTSDPEVALQYATNRGTTSGVVLTNRFAQGTAIPVAPNIEAIMGESEYLVPGPTSGASVTKAP
jgi:RHS repeat-associated protein